MCITIYERSVAKGDESFRLAYFTPSRFFRSLCMIMGMFFYPQDSQALLSTKTFFKKYIFYFVWSLDLLLCLP